MHARRRRFFVLAHLTDILTNLITTLYVQTSLAGILLAMAIESCCIPLPSELIMPLAGIMIASGKLLPGTNTVVALLLVALAGSLGCLAGSSLAYYIGYKGGRPLMLKYGRYLLISQHDADLADKFFQRWGSPTAFFSRLLPVVRTYISLPAGITKMPFGKFALYTVLGSFPWCLALAYVGTILGNHLDTLSPIFHSLDVVILVVLVILVILYVWRHVRNDRRARAEHAAQANGTQIQNGQPSLKQSQPQPVPQYGQPPSQQQSVSQWGQPYQSQQPQQFQGGQNWPPASPQPPQPSQPQQVGWSQPQAPQAPQPPPQQWGTPQPPPRQWNAPQPPQQWRGPQ
jgi:membrane protein DedA with SNARE-associated domain